MFVKEKVDKWHFDTPGIYSSHPSMRPLRRTTSDMGHYSARSSCMFVRPTSSVYQTASENPASTQVTPTAKRQLLSRISGNFRARSGLELSQGAVLKKVLEMEVADLVSEVDFWEGSVERGGKGWI